MEYIEYGEIAALLTVWVLKYDVTSYLRWFKNLIRIF